MERGLDNCGRHDGLMDDFLLSAPTVTIRSTCCESEGGDADWPAAMLPFRGVGDGTSEVPSTYSEKSFAVFAEVEDHLASPRRLQQRSDAVVAHERPRQVAAGDGG